MKSIFLVDDDEDDREFFEEAIKDLDILTELTIAKDGVELMTLLDQIGEPPPPHVIFLDLNMPRKNGYECLKEIRETTRLKNIPVVIFSTTANDHSIETTYTLGANCYIRKPHTHQLLKKAIQTALETGLCQEGVRLPKEKFLIPII